MRTFSRWCVALAAAAWLAGCNGVHGAVTPAATTALARAPRAAGLPPWTVTFRYSPAVGSRTFVVPQNISSVVVLVQGAQGSGALGGVLHATIPVKAGASLGIVLGSQGKPNGTGGFNGGGDGGGITGPCCKDYPGGGGGGASDVRSGGMALQNRILVAGGGGGSSGGGWVGGAGGGAQGGDGTQSATTGKGAGGGGTQTQGGKGVGGTNGAFENGGTGETRSGSRFGGGGGGGGYYGGGGGRASDSVAPGNLDTGDSGGGGGSGYVEPGAIGVTQTSGAGYGDGLVQFLWSQQLSTKASKLGTVRNIAVDGRGDIFYASNGSSVTEFDIAGKSTTVGAGFGKATAVAVDSVGNVFVADADKQTIWKVAPPFSGAQNGRVSAVVHGAGPNLYSVAVDNHDNIYLGENGSGYSGSIVEYDKNGKNKKILAAKTNRPISVAVDAFCNDKCVVYFTDYIAYTFSHLRRLFMISGGTVTQITNVPTDGPTWVAVDETGNAYVGDLDNNTVAYVPVGDVPQPVGTSWNGPGGVAVPPGCSSFYAICPVYVSERGAGDILEVR